jgi:hypothetical protein
MGSMPTIFINTNAGLQQIPVATHFSVLTDGKSTPQSGRRNEADASQVIIEAAANIHTRVSDHD